MNRDELKDVLADPFLLERLHGAALRVVGNEHEAWDAAQEAITRALQAVNKREVKLGPGGAVPYLVACARNAAKNLVKKIRGRDFNRPMPLDEMPEPYFDCGESDPESVLLSTNPAYALASLIDLAPPANRRTAIEWYCSEGTEAVSRHAAERKAGRIRARQQRLRIWAAAHEEELQDPANGFQEGVTDVLEMFVRQLRRIHSSGGRVTPISIDNLRLPRTSRDVFMIATTSQASKASLMEAVAFHALDYDDLRNYRSRTNVWPWSRELFCTRDGVRQTPQQSAYLSYAYACDGVALCGECPDSAVCFAWSWQFMKEVSSTDPVGKFAWRKFRRNALRRVLHHIASGKYDSRVVETLTAR